MPANIISLDICVKPVDRFAFPPQSRYNVLVATIKEIAREAGVGIATVSRVVNGSPLVKDATRTKVLDVIRRLNYRPNIMARKLVKGTFSETTVGIILPLIDNQFLFGLQRFFVRGLMAGSVKY